MDWIWNAALAWLGWNIVAPTLFLVALLALVALAQVPRIIRQSRCAHPRLYQTGVAGTEQHCAECRKFVCYTWDLPKRDTPIRAER
jgi:hypothetical protein